MVGAMMCPPVCGDASFEEYEREKGAILASLKRRAATVVSGLRQLEGVTCAPLQLRARGNDTKRWNKCRSHGHDLIEQLGLFGASLYDYRAENHEVRSTMRPTAACGAMTPQMKVAAKAG